MSAYASIRPVLIAYRTISATPRTPSFPDEQNPQAVGSARGKPHAQSARNANGLTHSRCAGWPAGFVPADSVGHIKRDRARQIA